MRDAFAISLREFEERHDSAIELGMERRGDDVEQYRALKRVLTDEAVAG